MIEADADTLRLLRGERETVAVALRDSFFVVFSADWFCGFLHFVKVSFKFSLSRTRM